MSQKLLAGLVGLDHLVAEALNRCAGLTTHLRILNQQDGHPSYRAAPIICVFSGVGVGAAKLQETRAVELVAWLKAVERALVLCFDLHAQSFVAMIKST